MYLVRIKKAHPPFVKDGVYLFDEENVKKVPPSFGDVYKYSDLPKYTNQLNLLIIRSGGIGDLMAYSILHDYAPNVYFITQGKYRPFMKLWQTPPIFKEPKNPIFMAKNDADMRAKMQTFGVLSGAEDRIEYVSIENGVAIGSRENWYDIINEAANQPSIRRRPQLVEPKGEKITGCLIVSKSSVVDRTANHEDIIKAVTGLFDHIILSHNQDWTEQEYIEALMRYEYVISVDTSAIHVREGFGLPALGLYGAFEVYSRTDGYLYTKSIQVESGCTPCHRHSRYPCKFNNNTKYAPCLTGERMIDQIRHEVIQWKELNQLIR